MDYMDEVTKRACEQINKKKEKLILDEIIKVCPDYNLEEDSKRIFPLVARVIDGDKEHYFFNKVGSEPLRLITFVTQAPKLNSNPLNMEFSAYIQCY